MEDLQTEWRKKGFPEFKIRIGIHQGPVIAGHFGDTRRSEFTTIGLAVNFAARIEAVAAPTEILVSDIIRGHVQFCEWETSGTFNLKGINGEQTLYRVKSIVPKSLSAA